MNTAVRSVAVIAAAITVDLVFWNGDVATAGGDAVIWWVPVAATVAVHLSLWWRRTHPLEVFAVQVMFALVSVEVPLWQPVAGLLVATFAVAAHTPARVARLGWLAAAPLLSHSLALAEAGYVGVVGLTQATLLNLAAGVAMWVAGRRVFHRQRRLRAWQAEQERLRAETSLAERVRLARELHDGVANTITAVAVQAAAARASGNGDPRLSGIESTARRAMAEVQETLQLMPRSADTGSGPTLDDLPALVAMATEAGLEVDLTESGVRRDLPVAMQTAAYRAVQEGLTNALKYTPPGTPCRVSLAWGPDELAISIVDRPPVAAGARPALPATGGRGLAGLRERFRPLGGVLECGADEGGFRLAARLPVGAR
ncbi:MAG: histidine kinase [Micropruina sp.]|nr:hypothetical protein [Micropruina sp.]